MNILYVLSGSVVAIAAICAGVWRSLRAAYKRGGAEREFKIALDSNTEATKELTGVVSGVVETLNDHRRLLDNHDWRLERLEATPSVNVNVSPHRDSGLSGGHSAG